MKKLCDVMSILSALLVLMIGINDVSSAPEKRFNVGETFPNLVLPALRDGRPTSIEQFRGKKVILHIFASW